LTDIEFDPRREYTLIGDISISMQTPDCPNGASRYAYMSETFADFIGQAEQFDPNGPTVILYGQRVHVHEDTNLAAVRGVLGNPQFERMTMTGSAVRTAYELHQRKKAVNASTKSIALVFTDGTWHDNLEAEVVRIANDIGADDEFGICLITVGQVEPDLAEALRKLDDELQSSGRARYDILDVKALEDIDFVTAADGAVND
jgi:hypothetical protein